jgi:Flp pilus assembly protein TadG
MVRILRRNRRGTAIVEMAIVLLLLIMVTMGAIRYGWLFLKMQQITNAARQGARLAILPGVTTTNVTDAIDQLMAAAGIGTHSVTITPGSVWVGDSTTGHSQPTVTVAISVNRADLPDIMDLALLPAPANLGAEVTMAKEEPNSP